jgi:hypothetical protein
MDEDYWSIIQNSFTVPRGIVNLNNGGVSPSPRIVTEALVRYIWQQEDATAYTMWQLLEPQSETIRTGLAEISLPDLQPGSSIMPGKVNPVIPEAVLMVAAQVTGNDATIATAGASGDFELNVMLPVIARNVLESIRLLANVSRLLADRTVDGITANRERAAGERARWRPMRAR